MGDLEHEVVRAQPGVSTLWEDLLAHRQSVAIPDSGADPRVPAPWLERLDVKALLCLPIGSTQDRLGCLLLLDTRAPRQWRSEEIDLVESFVNRAALALVNASLHKQLEWAAALEERQRIAADMHDGLAQTLSLLGLQVDQVSEFIAAGSNGESLQELYRVRELIELASHDVRRSIASLQETPRPRRSLQDQLASLIEQHSSEHNPPLRPIVEVQDPLLLSPEHEEQILPIVQEALLNALYHAQATRVDLTLERQADRCQIIVRDDGRGFDPAAAKSNGEGHFGLSIMRARAARIGAELRVDSQPGHGAQVVLRWTQTGENVQFSGAAIQPQSEIQSEPILEAAT
jgi:signal transduction histidine kinase